MSERINEAEWTQRLGDMAKQGVKSVRDRAMYAAGSKRAMGRLNLNFATKHVMGQWKEWSERQFATGNRGIRQTPTLRDLSNFLQYAFGLKFSPETLVSLGKGSPAQEPAAANEPGTRADKLANDALKNTTPAEREKLKKAFGKSNAEAAVGADLANAIKARRANESVIHEDGEATQKGPEQKAKDEAVTKALKMTFNPKVVFPKLANYLIDNGYLSVTRDGQVVAGTGHGGSGEEDDKDDKQVVNKKKAAAIANAQTDDGLSIDVKLLARTLDTMQPRIDKNRWDFLRTRVTDLGSIAELVPNAEGDNAKGNANLLASLVYAAMKSIVPANKVAGQSNVTAAGTVIDINVMLATITQEHNVPMQEVKVLWDRVGQQDDAGRAKLRDLLLEGNPEVRRIVFAVIDGLMKATATVGTDNKESA